MIHTYNAQKFNLTERQHSDGGFILCLAFTQYAHLSFNINN